MTPKKKPTETEIEAAIAEGNYLLLAGYQFQVGTHVIQWLQEQPAVLRQIRSLDTLLALLGDNWSAMPLVASVDGRAVVLVRQVDDLFRHPNKFPHERFKALMFAGEQIAEKVVNPERIDGRYRAPSRGDMPLEELLAMADVREEAIRHVLADVARSATDGVGLVPVGVEEMEPFHLPNTEALRKPPELKPTSKSFSACIVEVVRTHGWLVREDGQFIQVPPGTLDDFKIGEKYSFTEMAEPTIASRKVLHARCDGPVQAGLLRERSED